MFLLIQLYTKVLSIEVKLGNLEMGKMSSLERTGMISPVATMSPQTHLNLAL